MTHQRRHMRNQPVQYQTGKECSQNTLHTDQFHQSGSQKHHGHHKDILHHIVTVTPEEPASDPGECIHDKQTKQNYFQDQPHPEHVGSAALEHTGNHGQNQ